MPITTGDAWPGPPGSDLSNVDIAPFSWEALSAASDASPGVDLGKAGRSRSGSSCEPRIEMPEGRAVSASIDPNRRCRGGLLSQPLRRRDYVSDFLDCECRR